MGLKVYLPVALIVFLVAATGADVIAQLSIGGQSFTAALQDSLATTGEEIVGTIVMVLPFLAVALICASAEERARTRSVLPIFALAMLTLLYFYFEGHIAAEHAMLQKKWTAAALSIGLPPIFIGIPVVLAALGGSALAKKFDRTR